MQGATLVLRDIHQPPAPPWWPPAPGWWLLAAAVLLLGALLLWWRARRRRRQRAIEALFDTALADASTPAEQVAAMSELLRRAARRRDPDADHLHGEAWLAFLDRESGRARAPARHKRGLRVPRLTALKPSPSRGGLGGDGVEVRERPQQQRQTHPHPSLSLEGEGAKTPSRELLEVPFSARADAETASGSDARRDNQSANSPTGDFVHGPGRLLLDGGYRRDTDPQQVAALRTLARTRFLQWMARR